ncbi:hypothetical protein HN51_012633 [Arachis hypogaea]
MIGSCCCSGLILISGMNFIVFSLFDFIVFKMVSCFRGLEPWLSEKSLQTPADVVEQGEVVCQEIHTAIWFAFD